jgi:heme-binding protein
MTRSATVRRRVVADVIIASALSGVVATTTIALPTASAAPCTASGLASTASGVMASAGTYLGAHPGADDVLTKAGSQPTGEAKASVQSYFSAHPNEFLDLKGIAQPLTDLRNQCGVSVSPGQLAALVESFQ